ncbi:hypothetical protein CLF_112073 [Clonorchis sinensis]|uniref:Uncharacterized protein n=1 Tax=Clonorchis sinensis TaxID=79923 RepID=H2KVE4_CLOSI|nr:hypothetical protein CLF_112073 [Clonorchis sinensis]
MPPKPNHARLSASRRRIFHVNARRLLQHSTVHGLSHVSSASSHVGRITWFVLFVTGIAGFCINLSLIVSRYLSKPVLTSIFNDHDDFVWPDITICNPSAPYVVHLYDRQEKWLRLRDWAKNVAQYIPSELFAAIDEADKVEIRTQALMHSTMSPSDFGVGIPNETVNFVAADTGHYGIVLTVELDGNLTYLSPPMEQYFRTHILQKRYNIPCYTLQTMMYGDILNIARSRSGAAHSAEMDHYKRQIQRNSVERFVKTRFVSNLVFC